VALLRLVRRLRNWIDFPLRGLLRLRHPVRRRSAARLDTTLSQLGPAGSVLRSRADHLVARTGLAPGLRRFDEREQSEILAYADLIETVLTIADVQFAGETIDVLDVGIGDWIYASALLGVARGRGAATWPAVSMVGIEVDPWRLYRDGHARIDWAEFYSADLPGTRIVAGDFLAWSHSADFVTLLFPFVDRATHEQWGLPGRFFNPPGILRHAWSLVRENGVLLIVNQGTTEAEIQEQLLVDAGISIVARLTNFESPFYPYQLRRWAFLAQR